MIYDIRTTEYAQQTLTNLTGVPISIWVKYLGREREYKYTNDLVADVINSYGYLPRSYLDFEFVYFHVTTSANGCASFQKHGILNLRQSYSCHDSELRSFLEERNININLDERTLIYHEQEYDITFGDCPRQDSRDYMCWAIGRKFYFDFTTCGFLSVWERSSYGGEVHRRPEILMNIDDLLGLNLSQEWISTHDSYEIVAKVNGDLIVYDGDDDQTDEDKVLNYLTKAYLTAFLEPTEEVLLLKNHVQISPMNILEIKSFEHWKEW